MKPAVKTVSQNSPTEKRRAILILGMHRSGTSAFTRVCNLLGIPLGRKLLAASVVNEKGFWENEHVIKVHEDILKTFDYTWDDIRILPDRWWEKNEIKQFRKEVSNIIDNEFSGDEIFGIKDPRLCIMLPLWLSVLEEKNIEPLFIFAYRDASSVASSLNKRDDFTLDKSLLLWSVYNLEAEKFTRGKLRVFISFNELMSNWPGAVKKITDELSFEWPVKISEKEKEINDFLEPDLIHYKKSEIESGDKEINIWASEISKVIEVLVADNKKSEDKNLQSKLDKIYSDIRKRIDSSKEITPFIYQESVISRRKIERLMGRLHWRWLKIEYLKADRKRLKKELEDLKHHYNNLSKGYEIAQSEFWRVSNELERVKYQLTITVNSLTWRFAKPIRLLERILKMGRHVVKRAFFILKYQGFKALLKRIQYRYMVTKRSAGTWQELTVWFQSARISDSMVKKLRKKEWPENAPKISVIMPVYNTKKEWLEEAINSVTAQTYKKWELICINDCSTEPHIKEALDDYNKNDSRIRPIHLEKNVGVSRASNLGIKSATGDFICFMDHDDFIEPQAVQRFAEAVISDSSDFVYSDETTTPDDNINFIDNVVFRPQFSYDYYVTHPYIVHMIGAKKSVLDKIGGFDESLQISQDVDLILRILENSKNITHIPEILYRWRTHKGSLGHTKQDMVTEASTNIIKNHLKRIGYNPIIKPGKYFNFYDVDFNIPTKAKVGIVIPTKNRGDILKVCLESIERTTAKEFYDICIVNHDSDDPMTISYLKQMSQRYQVVDYSGKFNFSKIINYGVKQLKGNYTHYLILNNDIEALNIGWLEHMVQIAKRPDVGIVGSILLYPNRSIQHAGVIVGLLGAAEHAHKFEDFRSESGYNFGFNGSLLANRDYSAVTGACLLIKADLFNKINGMDEELAVGFGDIDLCLRAGKEGQHVVMDCYSVLIHHESLTRGKSIIPSDPHPEDSRKFIERYRDLINDGDPYYNPQFSTLTDRLSLNQFYKVPEKVKFRTIEMKLPKRN